MKPKFYVGLVDSVTEQKALSTGSLDALNGKIKAIFCDWFSQACAVNSKSRTTHNVAFNNLAIEIVVLTAKSNFSSCPILQSLESLGITIEKVPCSVATCGAGSVADFLAAKSSLILVIGDHVFEQAEYYKQLSLANVDDIPDKLAELIQTNNISTNIFNAVLAPELTADQHQDYYFNSNEFLPFLFQIDTQSISGDNQESLVTGFVRENEQTAFNNFLVNFCGVCDELTKASPNYLNDKLKQKLKESEHAPAESVSLAQFYHATAKFDAMASEHQARSNVSFWILFGLTLVLGASFLLYAKVFTDSPWLLILYLIAYTFGMVCFHRVKKKAALEKHLAYRLCSETMRLKLFQLVASDKDKVAAFQFERAISMASVKSDWIAHMIRAFPLHQLKDIDSLQDKKEIINEFLIDDQMNYFKLKLYGKKPKKIINTHKPKLSGIEKVLHSVATFQIFIVAISIFLMVTVALTAYKVGFFESIYGLKSVMMFLVGFLPLVALAFEQLVFNFALEENEMRYHHQISRFNSIKRWLQTANTKKQVEDVTEQLCVECAQEGFNWYTTRINRQHKPASGG